MLAPGAATDRATATFSGARRPIHWPAPSTPWTDRGTAASSMRPGGGATSSAGFSDDLHDTGTHCTASATRRITTRRPAAHPAVRDLCGQASADASVPARADDRHRARCNAEQAMHKADALGHRHRAPGAGRMPDTQRVNPAAHLRTTDAPRVWCRSRCPSPSPGRLRARLALVLRSRANFARCRQSSHHE
jgi:hypothetical protein